MYVLKKAIFAIVICGYLAFLWSCEDKGEEVIPDVRAVKDSGKITSCKEGMMCKEDLDCFDGNCVQGVCKCQSSFCQKDEDCRENMCCNVLNGSCYKCIKDVPVMDATEDIVFDADNTDIEDVSDDASFVCKKDIECPLNIPHCRLEKGICVECLNNLHCKSGICDIDYGKCILPDAGSDIVADINEDTQIDTGFDSGIDAGIDVITDISNPCDNYICLCGSICIVNSGNPECVSGCHKDADCCANTVCKSGKCEKTSCIDDNDCKDSSKPRCEIISGICYECTNDLHCQSNYYCDVNHICKYKVDECFGQCNQNNQWCNPIKKQCEDIPSNWCVACAEVLDPVCLLSGLTCGFATKRCTKQCSDNSECFGYTCNLFGWCSCP